MLVRKLVGSDPSSSLPHTPQTLGDSKPRSTAHNLRLSIFQYLAHRKILLEMHELGISYPFLLKSSVCDAEILFTEQPQQALPYKL